MDAKLIVIGGKANKSEVKLKLPTTIGRSRKADLTVAHPKVSRQHCEIFERDGVLCVKDFGSLNGTFIENNRITEAILKPGDKLTVGPLTFVAVYEPDGPIPADAPNPADMPTPLIAPIELPFTQAKVGRGAADTIAASPIRPRLRPLPVPEPEPERADETPAEMELPQAPTLPADAPEPVADDFSWLTGDTVPSPAPEVPDLRKPGSSHAYAETVSLKREDDEPDLPLAAESLSTEESANADALADPPAADGEDFSWLADVQDQPEDLAAFETTDSPPVEQPRPPAPRADSDKTTVGNPAPTVAMSKESDDDSATPAEDASPAASDDVPDFGSMALSPSKVESDVPSIVAPSASAKSPPHAAGKDSKSKAWWPFAGKRKDETNAKAPVQPAEKAPAPSEASSKSEPAAPAPPAAPAFVLPPIEEPAPEQVASAESDRVDDDALGQFFKNLK